MAETLNKRIQPALAAEARENARRYWAKKVSAASTPEPQPQAEPRDEPLVQSPDGGLDGGGR